MIICPYGACFSSENFKTAPHSCRVKTSCFDIHDKLEKTGKIEKKKVI